MKRREFIGLSAAGVLGLCLEDKLSVAEACSKKGNGDYSVVILGDTHFDTFPESVYHSHYDEKVEWLNRVQRAEFARNGEMWQERCPKLLKRAACLIGEDTRMAFQMGDLIQGDCGNGEVHKKMLTDVMDNFKAEFGGLPFVTVVGNHDIRGVDAKAAYHEMMPKRMSAELGKEITKTTFDFNIGNDAYIVIDFNHPDDDEVEKLLKDTKGARHTFVIVHGPLFPYDGNSCRWFYHGKDTPEHTEARLHFRREFARRNVIALCGHTHKTEFASWWGDGGSITQMTMNSVWSKPEFGKYEVEAEGAAEYGEIRKKHPFMDNGDPIKDETALFDEYRSGLRSYTWSRAAGSYKLIVSRKHVYVDFYAGDSTFLSHRFVLR